MSGPSDPRAKEIFLGAVERPEEERKAFLNEACGGDAALKAEVLALLAYHEDVPEEDLPEAFHPVPLLQEALKDRFVIEDRIGAGGMATVYRARDLKHDRTVAIKILRPDLTKAMEAGRFLREVLTTANLSHPHILPLFDSGEADGLLFYVMPFVKGESLRDRLTREGQLPVEEAVQIAREVADALAYAHEEGVVHRDVKPANIMLERGHALLADFGIARARARAAEKKLTGSGMSPGTPSYMSPEQAAGKEALDGRTDQYALACVLFEMLVGHPPFTGTGIDTILRQHINADPPSVTQLRPSVPSGVASAIHQALAKSPADRFRTTGEMAAALASTTQPEQRSTPTRSKLALILAAVTVVVVLVGAAYGIRSHLESTDVSAPSFDARPVVARSIAVLPFENNSPNPDAVAWFLFGIQEEVSRHLHLGGLTVRPPASVNRVYGAGERSLSEIANELQVDALLVGSGQVVGDRFRLSLSLIDVEGDTTLWQESYPGDYTRGSDIFDTQIEVAEKVASVLGAELTSEELSRIEGRGTQNAQAWIFYRQGRFQEFKVTSESLHRALELYDRAIEEDPRFGDPYVAKWGVYALLAHVEMWRPEERAARITAAAEAALRVDNTLAEAYLALADIKRVNWDFFAAEDYWERALRLDPKSARVHASVAQLLSMAGRDEDAISHIRRAQELDPVDRFIAANVAFTYYYPRRYDEALAEARKALDLDSLYWVTHWNIGLVRSAMGDDDAAVAELELAMNQAGGGVAPLCALGFAYARAGRRAEAEEVLRQLEDRAETGYVAASYVAMVYAGLDENDLAFEWLERAYQERDTHLLLHLRFHTWDSLRPDPRFRALEQKIGLIDYLAARQGADR